MKETSRIVHLGVGKVVGIAFTSALSKEISIFNTLMEILLRQYTLYQDIAAENRPHYR